MKPTQIDFAKLLRNHKSGWIGISSDFKKVVGTGKTIKEVRDKAKNKKQKIYFFPAGQNYSDFIG